MNPVWEAMIASGEWTPGYDADGVIERHCCPTYRHELHRTECPKWTRHGNPKPAAVNGVSADA